MKKKIAIICRTINGGGAERTASNMSIELTKFYDVHLIVFDDSNQTYPYGGKLHALNIKQTRNPIIKIINLYRRIRSVRRIKKKENIDCSISLTEGPNIVNVLSKVEDKTIISIRNNLSSMNLNKIISSQVKEACEKCDKIVALSEMVKYDLIDNFNANEDKIETIYNSCDGERLIRLANEYDENGKEFNFPYIINIGRLTKQKGQWHLIKAFKLISNKFPDLKLLILGEGELENELKELSKKLGIEDKVIFAGYVKNPHKIISNSQLFVFSSLFEGLGNVILEALACGKCVISTDCMSGPREILAPNSDFKLTQIGIEDVEYSEYGILVPAFNNEDPNFEMLEANENERKMANAIINILNDLRLKTKYEENALIRIKDFSPNNINSKWEEVIKSVIKNK